MNIRITGGSVNITDLDQFLKQLSDIESTHNVTVQALNADLVTGSRHLLFAVGKAIRSFGSGKNTANNLGMEIMLYASGNLQIGRALSMGVKTGDNRVAVVVAGNNGVDAAISEVNEVLYTIDPAVLEYSKDSKDCLLKFFNITCDELDAVGERKIPELVLERVALVDVIK
jgi:KEOPS complex subunit Cgi121